MGNQPTKELSATAGTAGGAGNAGTFGPGASCAASAANAGAVSAKNQRVIDAIMAQVVMANENCFGGKLAPWGDYKYDLDCEWDVVKDLIWKRRLAPFYIPLEDSPGRELGDIAAALRARGLHQRVLDKQSLWATKEEDVDDHRIHVSANAKKRRDLKLLKMRVKERAWDAQTEQEAKFRMLAVPDAVLRLYRDGDECPICFLFMPAKLNVTSCCHQRICTECFVQMKRLPPHLSEGESNVLESHPVKCPFCASEPFTVCFDSSPVGPDDIRPKWEAQMLATQKRRLRRSAAATLLHANSLNNAGHNGHADTNATDNGHSNDASDLENRIIAETLKLSLLEK